MENLNLQELLSLDNLPGAAEGSDVVVYEKLELKPVESHPTERSIDLEEDYALARQTGHYINQMIMDMAEIALHNAKNSESPRHVEVFTALMNQLTSSNSALINIHKDMRKITDVKTDTDKKEGSSESSQMNIENATVFVGSPTELMQKVGSAYDSKTNRIIEGDVEEAINDGDGTSN